MKTKKNRIKNERVKTTRTYTICVWHALRRKFSGRSIYLYNYNKAKTRGRARNRRPGGGSVASSVFCGGRSEARGEQPSPQCVRVCNITSETIDCAGAREAKHAAVGGGRRADEKAFTVSSE